MLSQVATLDHSYITNDEIFACFATSLTTSLQSLTLTVLHYSSVYILQRVCFIIFHDAIHAQPFRNDQIG